MTRFESFSSNPCEIRPVKDVLSDFAQGSRIGFWPSYIVKFDDKYYLSPDARILSDADLDKQKENPDVIVVPGMGDISIIRGILFKDGSSVNGIVVDTTFGKESTNRLVLESIMHYDNIPNTDEYIPIKFCNDTAEYDKLAATKTSGAIVINGMRSVGGFSAGFVPNVRATTINT